jgi:2-polyprenyl-6-methoxyphenol hydroxylase-like FAD-dependent oxidoreductase
MSDHAVVVAGGGPTGLMLAGELALAGVDVAIVERRASQDLVGSRAGGLHSRTIEVLDQRGIADRFLSQGEVAQVAGFSQIRLDISDFPTRHPYGLALWQNQIERILAGWVDELAVPIYRGREVTGIAQDCAGVDVESSDGNALRADYLVGCDGGRSVVRKSVGIEFPGWDPTMSYLLAEVEMAFEPGREPDWGIRHDAVGVHALSLLEDEGPVRVMVTEQHLGANSEPTLNDLSEALVSVYGTDYGIHSPTWISRSTDMARQAAAYRDGRVLLAGDAAHVHHPVGGQGLNTGVQDAVNLGWKLAQVVKRSAPESLLDSYHAERHPVAARVLRNTMAQIALLRHPHDDRTKALRDTVSEVLAMDEPGHRRRPSAGIQAAARCAGGAAQLWRIRRLRYRRLGRSGSVNRREIHWRMEPSGAWPGGSAQRCVDPARRACRLGGRRHRRRLVRRAYQVVRAANHANQMSGLSRGVSAPERILQFPHMVLRLLQQRPQCLGDVRQPQLVGLRHALAVPVQLTLF